MKRLTSLLLLALGVATALAQDSKTVESKPQAQSGNKTTGQALATPRPKPAVPIREKKVRIGGFFGDVAAQKNGLRPMNPLDRNNPGPDGKNVSFDPMTGKASGFKLFTLEF